MTNDNSTRGELRKEELRENAVINMAFDLSLHPVIAAFVAYENACEEWENDTLMKSKMNGENAFIDAFQNHIAVNILNGKTDLETELNDAALAILEDGE